MNLSKDLSVFGLILAGGKGTRMQSPLPKVLLPIAGRPILQWVIDSLQAAGIQDLGAVIGGDEATFSAIVKSNPTIRIWVQHARHGTADAVAAASCGFTNIRAPSYARGTQIQGAPVDCRYTLVCLGDAPAVKPATLADFVKACMSAKADIGVIGMEHPNPKGYGRLLVDDEGSLLRIVEEKDADDATRKVTLCNTGIIFAKTTLLFDLLQDVAPRNAQKEYYLTDCFELSRQRGQNPYVYRTKNFREFDGINDPAQFRDVETWLMSQGSR